MDIFGVQLSFETAASADNVLRRKPKRELQVAFKIPFVSDFITKLCSQQAEVIRNGESRMLVTMDKTQTSTGSTWGLDVAASSLRLFE
jgi:hypothetical protein